MKACEEGCWHETPQPSRSMRESWQLCGSGKHKLQLQAALHTLGRISRFLCRATSPIWLALATACFHFVAYESWGLGGGAKRLAGAE